MFPLPPRRPECRVGVVLNDGVVGRGIRKKRSWYRRRLRLQRTAVGAVVGIAIAAVCWQNAARYLSMPSLHSSQVLPSSFWVRGDISRNLSLAASSSFKSTKNLARVPNVYPYSIVPGGLRDASDLRYAALRDYVVRRHYARFNFEQARLIRAVETRQVYLSYRIRDKVYWTHHRVRLPAGELLLTDGKITARARCGNQISESAQPDVSDEEPDQDVLDRPVAELESGPMWPVRTQLAMPELPIADPAAPKLFASTFIFPYEPIGVPLPYGKCPAGDVTVDSHCRKKHHGPVVPEPPTMVLAVSGLAFLMWRYAKVSRRLVTSRIQ